MARKIRLDRALWVATCWAKVEIPLRTATAPANLIAASPLGRGSLTDTRGIPGLYPDRGRKGRANARPMNRGNGSIPRGARYIALVR